MHRFLRLLGWLALATLVFVTLAPIGLRPVSAAPVSVERFGAFAVLGFLLACGYPRHPLPVLGLVIGVAAGLEALQLVEATRHGRLPDFLIKAAGGGFGVAVGSAVALVAGLRRGAPTRP